MHHGRHEIDPVDAMLLDQAHRLGGVETAHPDDMVAGEQRQMGQREGSIVIERAWIEHASVGALGVQNLVRVPHRPAMVDDDLGPPGRAAAGHGLPVGGGRLGRERRVVALQVGIRRHEFHAGRQRRIGADHQPGLDEVEDRAELVTGKLRRDHVGRGPQFPQRKARLIERVAVGDGDGDEVARLHAGFAQHPRALVGPCFELGPGQLAFRVGDGGRVRRFAVAMEPGEFAHRNVGHGYALTSSGRRAVSHGRHALGVTCARRRATRSGA